MTGQQPLKGQKALVTGANSGIGAGVARALAAGGADVVVNFVSRPEDAERVVRELQTKGVSAMAIRADVTREAENYASSKGGVRMLMQSLAQELAPHKIRVNSIGPGAIATPINTARVGDARSAQGLAHAHSVRPRGSAGGHRQGDRVARVGRLGLRARPDAVRGRRHDAVPGVRPWRIGGHQRTPPPPPPRAAARGGAGATAHWKRWGPYLAERQWGTVREDYSANGTAWDYFPHDHARSRAYRWGEDGLLGHLGQSAAPLLRARALERAGSDPQGAALRPHRARGQPRRGREGVLLLPRRHADPLLHAGRSTSTRRRAFPYAWLVEENARRGREQPGVRAARHRHLRRRPLLRRLRGVRQGEPERHPDPHQRRRTAGPRPRRCTAADPLVPEHLVVGAATPGSRAGAGQGARPAPRSCGSSIRSFAGIRLYAEGAPRAALHRERDQPAAPLRRRKSRPVRQGRLPRASSTAERTRRSRRDGTKARAPIVLAPGGRPDGPAAAARRRRGRRRPSGGVRPRLRRARARGRRVLRDRDPGRLTEDARSVMRQALAGLLWSKQCYHYDVRRWLKGDPGPAAAAAGAPPRAQRRLDAPLQRRRRLDAGQVGVSLVRRLGPRLPHVALALVDPDFAKEQLILFLREWYMHPNGQIPAYEWAFGDVNPPVHAWAAWRVYKIDARTGASPTGLPRARLPQAAAELHLVGEPQGPRGEERVRGRVPRPGQHRRLRPLGAAARRRLPRAVRRHRVDGDVLPEHAGDRARARAGQPAYEDMASSSSSTSSTSRTR